MHELAPLPAGKPRKNLVIVQEELKTVRCPVCKGLRGVSPRHFRRGTHICVDCKRGHVIPKSQFHNYWTSRYTMEEIRELARAIWE